MVLIAFSLSVCTTSLSYSSRVCPETLLPTTFQYKSFPCFRDNTDEKMITFYFYNLFSLIQTSII